MFDMMPYDDIIFHIELYLSGIVCLILPWYCSICWVC